MTNTNPSRFDRVEKVMSLTLLEFQATLAPLAGRRVEPNELSVTIPLGGGTVAVLYQPCAGVTFGIAAGVGLPFF
jgi:hypothetical protein